MQLLPVAGSIVVFQHLHQRLHIKIIVIVVVVICVRRIFIVVILVFIILKPKTRNDEQQTLNALMFKYNKHQSSDMNSEICKLAYLRVTSFRQRDYFRVSDLVIIVSLFSQFLPSHFVETTHCVHTCRVLVLQERKEEATNV